MTTNTLDGTYGSSNTECNVITATDGGTTWYCVEGRRSVNATAETLESGVNVEMVEDVDCFTWSEEINTEAELVEAIEA